jgi:hypothetical protein
MMAASVISDERAFNPEPVFFLYIVIGVTLVEQ